MEEKTKGMTKERSWWIDGRKTDAVTVRTAQGVSVLWDADLHFALPDPLARSRASMGAGAIEAPMPGQITEVRVAPGADVVEGQRLVTLEAMKMEHVLRAPRAGTVAEVRVNVGDQVEAGTMILSLAIEEGAE